MYTGSGVYVTFGIILFLFGIVLIFLQSTPSILAGFVALFFAIILFYVAKQLRIPKPKVIPRTTPVYGIKCPNCDNITGTFNKTCPSCGAKLK